MPRRRRSGQKMTSGEASEAKRYQDLYSHLRSRHKFTPRELSDRRELKSLQELHDVDHEQTLDHDHKEKGNAQHPH